MASIAAVDGPQEPVHEMVAEFKSRREMLINGLNSIKGISCVTPKGAFYAFPNIKATGLRSGEFADRMLMEGGVALLSGTSFGNFGEGYIRLSFANSQENLQIALDRIENFLADKA